MSSIGLLLRWEGRIGHPRQFVSRLTGLLQDSGFRVTNPGIRQKQAVIRDAAEYEGSVYGGAEVGGTAWIQLLIGLPLILLVVGIWLVRDAVRRPTLEIDVEYEGEEYFASAVSSESVGSSERVGTISDLRITVRHWVEWPPWRLKRSNPTITDEIESLVSEIEHGLETLLPSIQIQMDPLRNSLQRGE